MRLVLDGDFQGAEELSVLIGQLEFCSAWFLGRDLSTMGKVRFPLLIEAYRHLKNQKKVIS